MAAPAVTSPPPPTPHALRALLAEGFPGAVLLPDRPVEPLATGLAELDVLLPGGGLPRGRVVTWRQAGGGTALLRSAAAALLDRGERVGWIDGARALGSQWADGPLVVRPASAEVALRAAEILLRSSGFALVVLAGVAPDRTDTLRLSRMAHEGGGAFVMLADSTRFASLRLTSRFLPDRFRRALDPFGEVAAVEEVAVAVEARASGWHAETTLHLPLTLHDLRLSLDPGLADRRGALG